MDKRVKSDGSLDIVSAPMTGDGAIDFDGSSGYVRTPLVEKQLASQAEAHGMSEDEVLEQVILETHAVKRLIEPAEVAGVIAFLAGEGGASFSGVPVTMDLGWSAR